ncbi:MAG TPA: hypothetical protein VKN16_07065 [Methylomirabilota bacterium]|jgi:hypothetical protein|nr:hypothetical protein [Methylomirabilota bacterium]
MATRRFLIGLLLTGLLTGVTAAPARAVEYRLEVVNLWETALYAYAKAAELHDGASGPGLERFQQSLDDATMSRGVVLGDRTLRWASESVARAYGTTRVLAEIRPGGDGHPIWDEVRWEGKPGERSVWMVLPSGRGRPERLYRAVLKGDGPPRQFQPYVPTRGTRSAAVKYPLAFLWAYESRGTVWDRYVSGSIDLSQGIAAVVGENDNQSLPDQVYLIVEQGAQPTTYKAMLLWREPAYNQQAPSQVNPMPK